MNNLLKSLTIPVTGAIIITIISACTPGKAQTRGNDYKGSFQNEEFEAFDNGNSDDEIPAMNNKGKVSNSTDKYANSSKKSDSRNMRVKSANDDRQSGEYKEAKGKYSDSENFDYDADTNNNGRNESYENENSKNAGTQEKFFQKGMASWYGREFHGKATASGERFDMNDMTAAHKTLPFGTVVEVRNFENGKAVRLKINDRGPYRGNRIIDLSFGAAREIDMIKAGEVNVGIKVIKLGDKNAAGHSSAENRYVEPVADDESYTKVKSESRQDYSSDIKLQAGAFLSRKNAENLKGRIEGMTDRPVKVVQDGDLYKVRIEGLRDKKEMNRLKGILRDDNISSFSID